MHNVLINFNLYFHSKTKYTKINFFNILYFLDIFMEPNIINNYLFQKILTLQIVTHEFSQ